MKIQVFAEHVEFAVRDDVRTNLISGNSFLH